MYLKGWYFPSDIDFFLYQSVGMLKQSIKEVLLLVHHIWICFEDTMS